MDLKISLKSENGLFNFLKKKIKKKKNFFRLPPFGAIWRHVAPGYNLRYSTVVYCNKKFDNMYSGPLGAIGGR